MPHTPGPWTVVTDAIGVTRVYAGQREIMAARAAGEWLDNARLVAAAPELLAAAQRALIVLDGLAQIRRPGDTLDQLAAAIARAGA